ncbi:hypothetical protein [Kitasatospora sp. NPDC059327]|uniref:hypothetical protein n=1 Tax=Kitasatospora sp. NPDC059327 TaxID=3346803 RepID=UPI0036AE6DAD
MTFPARKEPAAPKPAKPVKQPVRSSRQRDRELAEQRLIEAMSSAVGRATKGRGSAPISITATAQYRNPHLMLGEHGYSVVSNAFMSRVLAPVIAARNMTPTEVAVLLYCMGEQKKGFVSIKRQQDVADFLVLPRTNVSSALVRLEEWHMIRKVNRTKLQMNPTLCFNGNGDLQQEELTAARLLQATPGDFPDLVVPSPRTKKGSSS